MPDSKVFGVAVYNAIGNHWFFAYDASNNREENFSIVKPAIAQALLERFGEQAKNDPAARLDPVAWVGEQNLLGRIPDEKN